MTSEITRFMTVPEAADAAGLPVGTIERALKPGGGLSATVIGKARYLDPSDLAAWLNRQRADSRSAAA